MRDLDGLKIEESIEKRRLIFNKRWQSYKGYWTISSAVLLFFLMILGLYLSNFREGLYPMSKQAMDMLLPITLLLLIYLLYCIYGERNLLKTKIYQDIETSQDMLKSLLGEHSYKTTHAFNNLLIAEKQFAFEPGYGIVAVFIFQEESIYYTLLRDRVEGYLPTTTSHWILHSKIRKLFKS